MPKKRPCRKESDISDDGGHLGDRIRSARKAAHMTQGELALRVGVSRTSIAQWEKGETVPRYRRIFDKDSPGNLAQALGVTPSWLVTGQMEVLPTTLDDALDMLLPLLKELVERR